MEQIPTKKCPHCQTDIPLKAKKCPHCQTDLRGFINRHPIVTLLALLIIVPIVLTTNNNLENPTNTPVVPTLTAEQIAAWKETPSGKLCDKNPSWQKEDCDRLIERSIWIGMTYDMVVHLMGKKPDSTNPSNYGGGTKYQYCWTGGTPSCFYDDNGDGVIDAYN